MLAARLRCCIWHSAYLEDVHEVGVADGGKADLVVWVDDGQQLADQRRNVLEWGAAVDKHVEDTAEWPDVTGRTNLVSTVRSHSVSSHHTYHWSDEPGANS